MQMAQHWQASPIGNILAGCARRSSEKTGLFTMNIGSGQVHCVIVELVDIERGSLRCWAKRF